jgi:hypothetical protein
MSNSSPIRLSSWSEIIDYEFVQVSSVTDIVIINIICPLQNNNTFAPANTLIIRAPR